MCFQLDVCVLLQLAFLSFFGSQAALQQRKSATVDMHTSRRNHPEKATLVIPTVISGQHLHRIRSTTNISRSRVSSSDRGNARMPRARLDRANRLMQIDSERLKRKAENGSASHDKLQFEIARSKQIMMRSAVGSRISAALTASEDAFVLRKQMQRKLDVAADERQRDLAFDAIQLEQAQIQEARAHEQQALQRSNTALIRAELSAQLRERAVERVLALERKDQEGRQQRKREEEHTAAARRDALVCRHAKKREQDELRAANQATLDRKQRQRRAEVQADHIAEQQRQWLVAQERQKEMELQAEKDEDLRRFTKLSGRQTGAAASMQADAELKARREREVIELQRRRTDAAARRAKIDGVQQLREGLKRQEEAKLQARRLEQAREQGAAQVLKEHIAVERASEERAQYERNQQQAQFRREAKAELEARSQRRAAAKQYHIHERMDVLLQQQATEKAEELVLLEARERARARGLDGSSLRHIERVASRAMRLSD